MKIKKILDNFYFDDVLMRPKKRRLVSTFLVLFVATFLSIYGFGLLSKAQEDAKTKTAADDVINNTNNSYNGVSIHTKVVGPDGITATVKKGNGDIATFTLTVTNADIAAKSTDVKFTLPAGFTFEVGSASITPTDGTNVASPPGGILRWTGYNAPVGDSTITFRTRAP